MNLRVNNWLPCYIWNFILFQIYDKMFQTHLAQCNIELSVDLLWNSLLTASYTVYVETLVETVLQTGLQLTSEDDDVMAVRVASLWR